LKTTMSNAPKNTPWGKPQTCDLLAEGIWSITTSSHGGIKLDRDRNAKVPEGARRPSGWYEEDCDWVIVALVYPDLYSEQSRKRAKDIAKNYLPAEYTAITGETLTAEDSVKLRREAFDRANFEKFVARAAWGLPDKMVRVLARRASTGEEAYFVVPAADYGNKPGFVIDETKHLKEETPCER
jgi:hypothetical protein